MQRGIASLTEAQVHLDEVIDGPFVAHAVMGALNADAYYRCPYTGGAAYVLVELPDKPHFDERSAGNRSHAVVTMASTAAPVLLSRRSVEAYVGQLGATIERTPDSIRVNDDTSFEFDEMGFLKAYQTTLEP